jgi:hypothetical protein
MADREQKTPWGLILIFVIVVGGLGWMHFDSGKSKERETLEKAVVQIEAEYRNAKTEGDPIKAAFTAGLLSGIYKKLGNETSSAKWKRVSDQEAKNMETK